MTFLEIFTKEIIENFRVFAVVAFSIGISFGFTLLLMRQSFSAWVNSEPRTTAEWLIIFTKYTLFFSVLSLIIGLIGFAAYALLSTFGVF